MIELLQDKYENHYDDHTDNDYSDGYKQAIKEMLTKATEIKLRNQSFKTNTPNVLNELTTWLKDKWGNSASPYAKYDEVLAKIEEIKTHNA